MKTFIFCVGAVLIFIAGIATPVAIGFGLYDWVGNDMEFKYALWEGFKLWVFMIVVGLGAGLPCYLFGAK